MNDVPAWQVKDLAPPEDDASTEELSTRYSFIPKLMQKVPGLRDRVDFADLSETAIEAFHDARQALHVRTHGEEDVPGWRLFVTTRNPDRESEVQFAGVMKDGTILQGSSRDLPQPTKLPSLTGAQPAERGDLAQTHALASMAAKGFRDDPHRYDYAPDEKVDEQAYHGFAFLDPDEEEQEPVARVSYDDWLPLGRILPQMAKFAAVRTARLTGEVDRVLDERGVPEDARRHLGAILARTSVKIEMSRHGILTSRMQAALDPETREIANSTTQFSSNYLNWLNGVQGEPSEKDMTPARKEKRAPVGQIDRELGQRRRAFARDYPVLAGGVASGYVTNRADPRFAGRLGVAAASVDAGYPMDRVLVDLYNDQGMTRDHVAHLKGLTWQRAGREAFKSPEQFLAQIAATPAKILPKRRPDYVAWRTAVSSANQLADYSSRSTASILAETRGNYGKFASKKREDRLTLGGIADHVSKNLLVPARYRAALEIGMPRSEALEVAFDALHTRSKADRTASPLGGHTLATAQAALDRTPEGFVPDRFSSRQDDPEFPDTPQRWAPLIGEGNSRNGTWREMTSMEDLKTMQEDQGLYRRHQGTFRTGFGIQQKEKLVFALESSDGQKSALVVDFAAEPGRARQFGTDRAWVAEPVMNMKEAPTPASEALWQEVFSEVRKTSPERFAGYGSKMMKGMEAYSAAQVERSLGFPIDDEAAFKKSWEKNSFMLAPSLRVLGPSALVARERAALVSKRPRQGEIRPTEVERD